MRKCNEWKSLIVHFLHRQKADDGNLIVILRNVLSDEFSLVSSYQLNGMSNVRPWLVMKTEINSTNWLGNAGAFILGNNLITVTVVSLIKPLLRKVQKCLYKNLSQVVYHVSPAFVKGNILISIAYIVKSMHHTVKHFSAPCVVVLVKFFSFSEFHGLSLIWANAVSIETKPCPGESEMFCNNRIRCRNNVCVKPHHLCDGLNDCGDWYDFYDFHFFSNNFSI